MRTSMIQQDYQNLVVKNNLNQIIAKFTIYVNREKGYTVFNTAEIEKSYENKPNELKEMYQVFLRGTEAFVKTYNLNNKNNPLKKIAIGTGFNRLNSIFEKECDHISPLPIPAFSKFNLNGYGNYNGDSTNSQFLILTK